MRCLFSVLSLFFLIPLHGSIVRPNVTLAKDAPIDQMRIITNYLQLRPVKETDHRFYTILFSNELAVENYGDGRLATDEWINNKIETWTTRWKNNDPLSAFVIERRGSYSPLGHFVIGYTNQPGRAQMALVLLPFSEKKLQMLVNQIALAIKDYVQYLDAPLIKEKPLDTIELRSADKGVERMLAKALNMKKLDKQDKNGHNYYEIKLEELEI